MKILKRIFSAVAALAVAVVPSIVGSVANAVKPVAPDNTEVIITKQVKDVTNPVTNTFSFVIAADSNNPATVTGVPATFTIPFVNVAPNATTKIAEQTYTLDFSNVDFPKVGDYYFKITEATTGWSTDTDNIYPRDNDEWYAYVSVRYVMEATDSNPKTGTPTSTMKATVATVGTENTKDFINPDPTATPAVTGNKDDITFDTTPEMTYIQIEKKVTGNLGDITEYFEYTIEFGDHGTLMQNKTVTLIGDFADHVAGCTGITANATSPKNVNTGATGQIKLCMKHDQTVKIGLSAETNGVGQIPLKKTTTTNYTYTVTETAKQQDTTNTQYKYKIFIDGSTAESTTGAVATPKTLAPIPDSASANYAAMVTAFNAQNVTKYNNNKEADPITGFFINYWPFMLLALFGIMGVCVVKRTSRKQN